MIHLVTSFYQSENTDEQHVKRNIELLNPILNNNKYYLKKD